MHFFHNMAVIDLIQAHQIQYYITCKIFKTGLTWKRQEHIIIPPERLTAKYTFIKWYV